MAILPVAITNVFLARESAGPEEHCQKRRTISHKPRQKSTIMQEARPSGYRTDTAILGSSPRLPIEQKSCAEIVPSRHLSAAAVCLLWVTY